MKTNTLIRLVAGAALATAGTQALAQGNPVGWQTTAGANLAMAKGNSDTLLVSGDILSLKKWGKNEFTAHADASYGDSKINGVNRTTTQNYGVALQYNRLLTDQWYLWANASARQDRIADIDYRISLSVGAGYYFIKNDRTQLNGEVGPGVVFERVGNHDTKYATIRFAEHLKHKLSDRATLFQNAEFLPQINKWDNYTFNFDIGVEAAITEKMGLRVTFADTYRSRPAPGLKHNDLKLLAGVTYKF